MFGYILINPSVKFLLYKIFDENGVVGLGVVKDYDDNGENLLFDDFYFSRDYGLYKKIDDNNKEILYLNFNCVGCSLPVVDFDFVYKVVYFPDTDLSGYPVWYFKGKDGKINFKKDDYSYKGNKYNLEIKEIGGDYFYKCFDKDGKFLFFDIRVSTKIDYIKRVLDQVNINLMQYYNSFKNNYLTKILDKLENLNISDLNIDLSPVLSKLNDIDSDISKIGNNFDILELVNLPQKIEEKIGIGLSLRSLNGSNGAKFKDGSKVKVANFEGVWEVLFSTTIVADENVLSVIYQVKQDSGLIMFVPEVYLELA